MAQATFLTGAVSLLALSACATTSREMAIVTPASIKSQAAGRDALTHLVDEIKITYDKFTLDNGLTVLVHTDRKAPVVATSIWYGVGSKNEPVGKTGFAHLFEHLMFNGSENAPDDFFKYTAEIGATDQNGTTYFDRTNYFQTVPKPALERMLFLEADRMGHLLGAVTQEKLDNQRGVVQNEKRQGDNNPYGLVRYEQLRLLFPDQTNPYAHSTIGSMADLNSASLADVQSWFRGHYGPNNAVLVLAGDIDAAEARPLVQRHFGAFARGPEVATVNAPIPTLAAPVTSTLTDKVATTRIYRLWSVPGLLSPDLVPLQVGASVLGGLASSRLDDILVRQEKLAVNVSAGVQDFQQLGGFQVSMDVAPGVDPDRAAARLDQIIADYLRTGPTADEVRRVAFSSAAETISGLEQVGGFTGKAVTLAEGQLYAGDPELYAKQLRQLAQVTPAQVKEVMNRWLSRPVAGLRVVPGERGAGAAGAAGAADAGAGTFSPPTYVPASPEGIAATLVPAGGGPLTQQLPLPPVGAIGDVAFPTVTTARLSNGIEVRLAERHTVPVVRAAVVFDAGAAADPKDKLGLQLLTMSMLDEGAGGLTSQQLAEAKERLGASLDTRGALDISQVSLRALTTNLAPSLDLMASVIRQPTFDPAELERVRTQQLSRIDSEMTQPVALAQRRLGPLLYGPNHPYGIPLTGSGEKPTVAALSRADLEMFRNKWIRPETARIFVVGDTTMAEMLPLLEARFGDWAGTGPAGAKNYGVAVPPRAGRIIAIDRPGSPQSLIMGGQVIDAKGTDDLVPLEAANQVLGGDFLSRLNTDLRETKGWSYGVSSFLQPLKARASMLVYAPVQTDQTGPSIAALIGQVRGFSGAKGVQPPELARVVTGNVRELPGSYEQSTAVLAQMIADAQFGRPTDYADSLAGRYRSLTAPQLDAAMRKAADPRGFTWLVVGDVAKIRGQLGKLGLPVTYMGAGDSTKPAR